MVFRRLLIGLFAVAIISAALPGVCYSEGAWVVGITKAPPKRSGLAIADFQQLPDGGGSANLSQKLPNELRRILEFTGLFIDVPKETFLDGDHLSGLPPYVNIEYDAWDEIGAEYLIKGGYYIDGKNITMVFRLFNVREGRIEMDRNYGGFVKSANSVVWRFANDLIEHMTGSPGVFGSTVVFSAGSGSNKAILSAVFGGDKSSVRRIAGGYSTQPAIGADGKIAYIHREGKATWQLIHGGRVVSSGPMVLTPAFSPAGSLLAAKSGKQATNIYRFDGPDKAPVQVTKGWGINISPTVSPDGGRVAFVSDRTGRPKVYVASMRGGKPRELVKERSLDPDWSPNGDRIAYSSEGDIFTCFSDGSDVKQLTQDQGKNSSPSWSPDGKLIVFSSTRSGRSQLFVMTAEGERQMPMIPDYKGGQRGPKWSRFIPGKTP